MKRMNTYFIPSQEYELKIVVTITAIRKLRGVKQYTLADFLNIDRSSYSKLESGKVNMSRNKLTKIADFLDTSINSILLIAYSIDPLELERRDIQEISKGLLTRVGEQKFFSAEELYYIFMTIKRIYLKSRHKSGMHLLKCAIYRT
jgi:transcriptional regulator with XRE-family HTH domain